MKRKPTAIERFLEKCRFEPETGCVLWTGGTTSGHGNNCLYGSFWFEGRRVFAHRWAAVHIHGLDVGELTVGHCCPHTPDGNPNSLCVEHLEVQTLHDNVVERNRRWHGQRRLLKAAQTGTQKQNWLFVHLGFQEAPPVTGPWLPDIPFFTPPRWLTPSRTYIKSRRAA